MNISYAYVIWIMLVYYIKYVYLSKLFWLGKLSHKGKKEYVIVFNQMQDNYFSQVHYPKKKKKAYVLVMSNNNRGILHWGSPYLWVNIVNRHNRSNLCKKEKKFK